MQHPHKHRRGRTAVLAAATAAAALVADGQTVMLDIGTTALQVARHLHGRRITLITTNLAVLDELRGDEAIELVLPGGLRRRNQPSTGGRRASKARRPAAPAEIDSAPAISS